MRTAALVSFFCVLLAGTDAVSEEPCNPMLEGTYCATQMPKKRDTSSGTSDRLRPLSDMSGMVPSSSVGGPPATLFGLSFQGSSSCVGLLRRSACN
jgi:hypothetical protein